MLYEMNAAVKIQEDIIKYGAATVRLVDGHFEYIDITKVREIKDKGFAYCEDWTKVVNIEDVNVILDVFYIGGFSQSIKSMYPPLLQLSADNMPMCSVNSNRAVSKMPKL